MKKDQPSIQRPRLTLRRASIQPLSDGRLQNVRGAGPKDPTQSRVTEPLTC